MPEHKADQAALDRYIDEHLQDYIADLQALCRFKTVSAQHREIDETAEATRVLLEKYGASARVMPTTGHPVVVGEASGASAKRVLCYNHYDVQPAEPLELWVSDPFDPEVRDGNLYGRGVGDDKGHIICRLAAMDALRAVTGELPCGVVFMIEGEEEVGSNSLAPFIEANQALFRADGCLWEFGGVDFEGRPQIFAGMRGDLYVELRAKTANRDAHSGLGGSQFPNAAWRLTWALASLKGPDERIRIPGWYDDVRPASERDLQLLDALPSEEDRLRETYGLKGFLLNATGLELKRRALFEPTCTIAGLGSGYQGPGSKTVLPCEAMAKVDFRLVPNQDPADLIPKLKQHLAEQGFDDIEVVQHNGYRAARVDPDAPFVKLVAETAWDVYDRPPAVHPTSGGSGPMAAFVDYLGMPIANVGIGYPDSGAHAPNEHIRLSDFAAGIKQTARVFLRMRELDGAGESESER
jgi:acetylornithine deacetylase/succinyl-diaminopimelate desuccinylase-like protein